MFRTRINGKATWSRRFLLLPMILSALLAVFLLRLLTVRAPAAEGRAPDIPYRFIAFGDWGAGTPFQKDIAAQAERLRQSWPFSDVLLLGDNFYPDGDVEKYGKPYFTDMYAPLLRAGVRFIVALGNHDLKHADEQVLFFRMPGRYYQVRRPLVTFFVIDSNTFADDAAQRQWLEQTLKQATTPWKIVMGHHPIYSSGKHGVSPALKQTLEPILIRENANLYLAGHDHDYERFTAKHGVVYLVSGGGGAYLRGFDKIAPGSRVRIKAHHFLALEMRRDRLDLRVMNAEGQVMDRASYVKSGLAEVKTSRSKLQSR